MEKKFIGRFQVYTGDGKGKTTAALGLALRACGAGLRVFIGQFIKGMAYAELAVIKERLEGVELAQYGRDCFITKAPTEADIALAQNGLLDLRERMLSGRYEVIIADELNIAVHLGLVSIEEVLSLINERPEGVELVLTGRYAHEKIIEAADLATEMREVKHYYKSGLQARYGIEK